MSRRDRLDVSPTGVIAGTDRVRRNVWGRLYHGETSIDFYGRKWWGLGISALLIVVTVVSLIFNGLNLGHRLRGRRRVGGARRRTSPRTGPHRPRRQRRRRSATPRFRTLTSQTGTERLRVQVGRPVRPRSQQAVQTDLGDAAGVDVVEVSSTRSARRGAAASPRRRPRPRHLPRPGGAVHQLALRVADGARRRSSRCCTTC